MIVFNCSQAFAEFIEPKKAAPEPLVCEAPSPHPSEDRPHLTDVDGQPPRHLHQWLVHFIRIQRKPCAVAMDIDTRYAMVFSHLKKGDPEAFLNTFATRWSTKWCWRRRRSACWRISRSCSCAFSNNISASSS